MHAFPRLSLLCQGSFSCQLSVYQRHTAYNYLHLPETRAALVLQSNSGVGVLMLDDNSIPSCEVIDPKRNLTGEQCTPCNSSQDSMVCLFLQTCKALEGSLLLPPALRCHLNRLRAHKRIGKSWKGHN